MGKRPTIVDVAGRAGVSKSTVSLVLQDSPLVKAETRDLVRRVMGEIGYVYNRSAAQLRSSNTGLIGLVINDLRNPFFTEFATSVQMALSARGYATVVANTDENPDLQAQVVGAMIEHGVSALVISPAYGSEDTSFGLLARAGVPTMQVLRRVADPATFPFAAPDYATGSRLATEHLIAGGARGIAFVGGMEGRGVTAERMSGYAGAMAKAGREAIALPGRAARAFGREVAHRLVALHPQIDAALCFNDLVALGMLTGFAEMGRRVGAGPGGFRLVGFDDIEDCAQVWPALSSVHCDIAGFGAGIAGTVLDWLEQNRVPPAEARSPVRLVARESSEVMA